MKYGADLHRKGELQKVEAMEKLAKSIERSTGGKLAAAFITEGCLGADCFAMIEQSSDYQDKSGYVLYDEVAEKAVFVLDQDVEEAPEGPKVNDRDKWLTRAKVSNVITKEKAEKEIEKLRQLFPKQTLLIDEHHTDGWVIYYERSRFQMRFNRGNEYFDTYYIFDQVGKKVGIIEDHCRGVKNRYFVGWKLYPDQVDAGTTESFYSLDEAMIYSVGEVVPDVVDK